MTRVRSLPSVPEMLFLSIMLMATPYLAEQTATTTCDGMEYNDSNQSASFEDAVTGCQQLGTGWSLPVVLSTADLQCVNTVASGRSIWLGLRTTNNTSTWLTGERLSLAFYVKSMTSSPANYCTMANSSFSSFLPNWQPVNCDLNLPRLCQRVASPASTPCSNGNLSFNLSNAYVLAFLCAAGGLFLITIGLFSCLLRQRVLSRKLVLSDVHSVRSGSQSPLEKSNLSHAGQGSLPDKEYVEETPSRYVMSEWEVTAFYQERQPTLETDVNSEGKEDEGIRHPKSEDELSSHKSCPVAHFSSMPSPDGVHFTSSHLSTQAKERTETFGSMLPFAEPFVDLDRTSLRTSEFSFPQGMPLRTESKVTVVEQSPPGSEIHCLPSCLALRDDLAEETGSVDKQPSPSVVQDEAPDTDMLDEATQALDSLDRELDLFTSDNMSELSSDSPDSGGVRPDAVSKSVSKQTVAEHPSAEMLDAFNVLDELNQTLDDML